MRDEEYRSSQTNVDVHRIGVCWKTEKTEKEKAELFAQSECVLVKVLPKHDKAAQAKIWTESVEMVDIRYLLVMCA